MKYIMRVFDGPVLYKYRHSMNMQRHNYVMDKMQSYRQEFSHSYKRPYSLAKSSGVPYVSGPWPRLLSYKYQAKKGQHYYSSRGLVKLLAEKKHKENLDAWQTFFYLQPASYSNSCKEVMKMAWRPTRFLIKGELDNTLLGKVTGWMRFAGVKGKVRFNLTGNFHRDIRGTRIRFKGDATGQESEAKAYMKGFARQQVGKVGDMTAGFEPADYVSGRCYLEWYGDDNGRVVIELEQDKVQIIGKPLAVEECEPVSRQEQAQNMAEFLQDIARSFGM